MLRLIRNVLPRTGIRFRYLRGPLRLITLSDSAFKAQDHEGLVMRACVILLVEQLASKPEGTLGGTPRCGLALQCAAKYLAGTAGNTQW